MSSRVVISWFGWDIEHFELISEGSFSAWLDCVEALAAERRWKIERLGNPIDLIIGSPGRSILPLEFSRFQREWETLNMHFDFRFSGLLWLMNEDNAASLDCPREVYAKGRKVSGESIGRPDRACRRKNGNTPR